jgi:nitrogen-specific signal transduction histidine kinase
MHMRFSPPSAAEVRENKIQRAVIVGQLAGGMLHDFNNILTVISGTIDILAEAVSDQPELAAIANLIDAAAVRGARLTSQLAVFARGLPSQPVETDVNEVVIAASGLLRATLGAQVETTLMLADDVPAVLADPGQLTAALLSLAIVAHHAMPDGGKLSFRTGSLRSERHGAIGTNEAEDAVVIAVHARGHKGEHPGRIFVDTKVVADFVSGSGGRIGVHDRGDDGAFVEIVLPKA